MATSTEQLNDAIAALTAAADAYNGQKAVIDARVNNLISSVSGTLNKTIYLDPVHGDDSWDGSTGAPVQTLEGAAALMSKSGNHVIRLRGNVVIDKRITLQGNIISIIADDPAIKRRLIWANQIDGANTESPVLYIGNLNAALDFQNIVFANITCAAHVTQKRMIHGRPLASISTYLCEFDTQVGDDLSFVFTAGQITLWHLSATIPAAQAGLWLDGVAAGTDPATQARVINTNLATL